MNREFLQSQEWLRFQEATRKQIVPCEEDGFVANGIIHALPLVGKYLYVPRGPVFANTKLQMPNVKTGIETLVGLASKKKANWIRIEPETEEMLEEIKKSVLYKIVRAPHDMQPREIFKIDISPSEEELLAQMKPKTRYNIRLAEKRGVKVFETREQKYIDTFLDLVTATSGRKGITSHARSHYEKFFSALPADVCRLFVAEYEGTVIVANIVIFYGDTTIYLHGGSSDAHRDVMAPYLLQWEQVKKAKSEGFRYYDFGGVKTNDQRLTIDGKNSWSGITKFKTGFSPKTVPITYPGSYDIVLDSRAYLLYGLLSKLTSFVVLVKKRLN